MIFTAVDVDRQKRFRPPLTCRAPFVLARRELAVVWSSSLALVELGEDGTSNLRSPCRKKAEALAICAQNDFDFQQNPIMIIFLVGEWRESLLRYPLYTTPLHIIYLHSIGSCCATPHPPFCWKSQLQTETAAAIGAERRAWRWKTRLHSTKPFILSFLWHISGGCKFFSSPFWMQIFFLVEIRKRLGSEKAHFYCMSTWSKKAFELSEN